MKATKLIWVGALVIMFLISASMAHAGIVWQKDGVQTMTLDDNGNLFVLNNITTTGGQLIGNLDWSNLQNVPAGLADGDDDTTYTVGGDYIWLTGANEIYLNDTRLNQTIQALSVSEIYEAGNGLMEGDSPPGTTRFEFDSDWGDDRYYTQEFANSTFLPLTGGTINGGLVVQGDFTIIGSTFNASVTNQELNGTFLPQLHNVFDIGSTSKVWANAYVTNLYATTLSGNLAWGNLTDIPAEVTSLISNNGVVSSNIVNGAILTEDIADGNITDAKIDSVSASKITGTIADGQVTQDLSVNTTKDIQTSGIIEAAQFVGDGSRLTGLAAASIEDNTIDSAKIINGGVQTVDIADGNVTDAKIDSVSASKITGTLTNAVDTDSITVNTINPKDSNTVNVSNELHVQNNLTINDGRGSMWHDGTNLIISY